MSRTQEEKTMFAKEFDSDHEKIQSTIIDLIAGAIALFLTLNWFGALVESIRGWLKDAACKAGVTVIDSTGKRITE
jgi:hypothetical protein